jgi:hypothetical protein
MWHAQHTLETTARPERVWDLVQRVAAWPQWDAGLAAAELAGSFSSGAQGTVRMSGHGRRTFRLGPVVPALGFTASVRVPLGEVRHIHSQEGTPMGTRLTHRVEIHGPLAWLYGLGLGRRLREGLAPGLRRLAQLAS